MSASLCPNQPRFIGEQLCYLSHTIDMGLLFSKTGSSLLNAFSDADWAGNTDDRRSTKGYVVFLGSNKVSWSSQK
jgi:hypothetical protein